MISNSNKQLYTCIYQSGIYYYVHYETVNLAFYDYYQVS